jgi:hypothetical protein
MEGEAKSMLWTILTTSTIPISVSTSNHKDGEGQTGKMQSGRAYLLRYQVPLEVFGGVFVVGQTIWLARRELGDLDTFTLSTNWRRMRMSSPTSKNHLLPGQKCLSKRTEPHYLRILLCSNPEAALTPNSVSIPLQICPHPREQ